ADGTGDDQLTPIHAKAAMVTTQAATHAGPWPKPSARGFGFTYLVLGDGDARGAVHRHVATTAVALVAPTSAGAAAR
ncbi:MAG: hypothetical protein ACXVCV_13050, partial [Polyangia bacterium]